MPIPDLPPSVSKSLPGIFGSAVAAAYLLRDAPMSRRIGMFLSGAALSYFATPDLARLVSLSEGLTGFMTGLLGMALAGKIFDGITNLGLDTLLRDWLRKVLGLPPKEGN